MKKVIFVHGYEGYPEKDWFPNIAKACNTIEATCSIPAFPGDSYPHLQDWLDVIEKQIQGVQEPIVLVAYSLGTRAVLLYLEKYQPKNIDTVILVAPFNKEWKKHRMKGNRAYNSFFEAEVNMGKVRQAANRFIVMHSKDDPHVPYEEGREIARELNAKLYTYEERDHFYKPENYKYVLEILKKVL
jgi:predicted alpha/beta hydrolase family esterase